MWPTQYASPVQRTTFNVDDPLGCCYGATAAALNAGAWPTPNKIIYVPFRVPFPVLVKQLYVSHGAIATGNINMAIYSRDGTLIVSKGSAVATTGLNLLDITDTLIGPGIFYVALIGSNNTDTYTRYAMGSVAVSRCLGVLMEAAASFAFPNTATFATIVDDYIPIVGISAVATL